MSIARKTNYIVQVASSSLRALGKPKIFGIGKNKTGTTSLGAALRQLGYPLGKQRLAENLLRDWARRDFRALFRYCQSAQAFQDVPFSLPFTFQALDQRFPGSRFILTVRDSEEQWLTSLIQYYAALFAQGRPPTLADLKAAAYVRPGWMYESHCLIHPDFGQDPFNKEMLIAGYRDHNRAVQEYFRHRPGHLLVLNVAQPGAYSRLCEFLGRPVEDKSFPWENKTSERKLGSGLR